MADGNSCNIFRVARQCGVILRDGDEHSPTSRRPFECYCKPTLKAIVREHGEAHLKLVLMLMTASRNNASELYADMIKAVSALLVHDAGLIKSRTLMQDFAALDLGAIRRQVKRSNLPVENWKALLVLISQKFLKTAGCGRLKQLEELA